MNAKEKIIEILKAYTKKHNIAASSVILQEYADELLANGVIVPPEELYSIVDKVTIYATVSKAIVEMLPLYVIKEPEKYGYYKTKDEAEEKLKELQNNAWNIV